MEGRKYFLIADSVFFRYISHAVDMDMYSFMDVSVGNTVGFILELFG